MTAAVPGLTEAVSPVTGAHSTRDNKPLVEFSTEDAIAAVLEGKQDAFVEDITDFGIEYALRKSVVRALFLSTTGLPANACYPDTGHRIACSVGPPRVAALTATQH